MKESTQSDKERIRTSDVSRIVAMATLLTFTPAADNDVSAEEHTPAVGADAPPLPTLRPSRTPHNIIAERARCRRNGLLLPVVENPSMRPHTLTLPPAMVNTLVEAEQAERLTEVIKKFVMRLLAMSSDGNPIPDLRDVPHITRDALSAIERLQRSERITFYILSPAHTPLELSTLLTTPHEAGRSGTHPESGVEAVGVCTLTKTEGSWEDVKETTWGRLFGSTRTPIGALKVRFQSTKEGGLALRLNVDEQKVVRGDYNDLILLMQAGDFQIGYRIRPTAEDGTHTFSVDLAHPAITYRFTRGAGAEGDDT